MDLNTVTEVFHPRREEELPKHWDSSSAYLAGGTWVFSDPQVGISRLINLEHLGWADLRADDSGLFIGATCPILELENFELPGDWMAAPLISQCTRALLASFKVKRAATVGGNICRALPAAAMVTLAVAMEGSVHLLARDGSERHMRVVDLIVGDGLAALQRGEALRSLHLPAVALQKRFCVRRAETVAEGRSMVFLVGTIAADRTFALTVTASTVKPFRIEFPEPPQPGSLLEALEQNIPDSDYVCDTYRTPSYRKHLTRVFATEILQELTTPETLK